MITLCCILTNLCKKRAKRLLSSLLVNKNGAQIALSALCAWCRRRESNSHGRKAHWILRPELTSKRWGLIAPTAKVFVAITISYPSKASFAITQTELAPFKYHGYVNRYNSG